MKKLFTLIAVISAFTYGAHAQRTIDLESLRAMSSDTIYIDSVWTQPSVIIQMGFVNHGPDSIVAGDSLKFRTPYGSFYYVFDTMWAINDTIAFPADTFRFTDGPATGDMNWCDSAYVVDFTPGVGPINDADLSNNKNCTTIYILNNNGTGIFTPSIKSEAISIYPNPTSDDINFEYNFDKVATATVRVIDLLGRTVITKDYGTQNVGNSKFTINVADLPNGLYTLEMVTDGKRAVSKFNVNK